MKNTSIRILSGALFAAAVLSFSPVSFADTVVTESTGTISEFSPETMIIRSETASEPVRYSVSKDVTYVDDEGAPVAVDVVKSGLPVTVHYVKEGDRTVARRVVVHRTKVSSAPVIEEKRTKTTTTTTTER